MWRVGCLPLIISISPSLIAALHQAPDGSGCVREEGRWNSQVWRCVMRHTWSEWSLITAAVICRVPLLWRPVSSSLVSSRVQEGSVERASAAPVTRLTGQDAGPYSPRRGRGPKEDEAARRSRRPSRSGPERGDRAAAGLRPLPGPFLPEHCPSFTTRAARRGHQIPCLFWTLHPLWTLYSIISVQ